MSVNTTSHFLYWLLLAPLLLIPAMWGYFLISIEDFAQLAKMNLPLAIKWNTVASWQYYLVWSITLVPALIILWGLFNLRRAFHAFSRNDVFNMQNVTYIKRFALALIAGAVLKTCIIPMISVVFSLNHPPGEKILSIQFSSNDFAMFAIGMVFWVIAKILIQANELSTENQQFV